MMMNIATTAALAVLALAFLLAVVRLVRGPSLPDRVVAVDLLTTYAIGTMAVTAISVDVSNLMQPALVLAFVGFVATVAFARYISKAGADQEDES
jgi:multicomponent Na+:H+ antiporter subunit F